MHDATRFIVLMLHAQENGMQMAVANTREYVGMGLALLVQASSDNVFGLDAVLKSTRNGESVLQGVLLACTFVDLTAPYGTLKRPPFVLLISLLDTDDSTLLCFLHFMRNAAYSFVTKDCAALRRILHGLFARYQLPSLDASPGRFFPLYSVTGVQLSRWKAAVIGPWWGELVVNQGVAWTVG